MTIPVKIKTQTHKYPIIIGSGLLVHSKNIIPKQYSAFRIAIITDTFVKKLCGMMLQKKLTKAGHAVELFVFSGGEKNKNHKTIIALYHQLLKKKYGRDTLIIALGGGVVGDIAGYVAATYLRGVPYIQIPTTLLAMVDSSIGGKTGIDTPYGKNTVGAFWQPSVVIMDTSLVVTLPRTQFINGLLEAIKSFFTSDAAGLKLVDRLDLDNPKRTQKILEQIIVRSVQFKVGVAERDERETNERRVLNFGHTVGHALEKVSSYKLPHGYAVGYGMVIEAHIANRMGILSDSDYAYLKTYLERFGIKENNLKRYSVSAVKKAIMSDKKVRDGKPYFVLLKEIGKVYTKGGQFAHTID